MTSRERLLASVNHQTPDRPAIDLASTQVTGISIVAYQRLRRYLGWQELPLTVCDAVQQICIPHDDILQRFGVDTRGLFPVTHHIDFQDHSENDCLVHVDEWGFGYRRPIHNGLWYDLYRHPLPGNPLRRNLIDSYSIPRGDEPRRIEGLRQQASKWREQHYAVVLKSVCAGLLEMMIRVRGMENALTDLLLDPKNSGRLLDKILQHKLAYWQMALTELGDIVDVVAEGDDFGTQSSQLISLATWRKLIKPRQTLLIQSIRSLAPQAKIFFHSCGNIREFLPEFIDMGIHIINPVHITAAGMAPHALKQEFGRDLVFWGGGIDTQTTLPKGTPEQVAEEVTRNIEILGKDGGYVFNTIHNIQADVPPENILAMYEAALKRI
ncbi:hypothetical protein GX408_11435 [bacterium]|nr:hypothetical protein [bacterium]